MEPWTEGEKRQVFSVVFDALMSRAGETQLTLARSRDMDQATVSRWRNLRVKPRRLELCDLLSQGLHADYEELDVMLWLAGHRPLNQDEARYHFGQDHRHHPKTPDELQGNAAKLLLDQVRESRLELTDEQRSDLGNTLDKSGIEGPWQTLIALEREEDESSPVMASAAIGMPQASDATEDTGNRRTDSRDHEFDEGYGPVITANRVVSTRLVGTNEEFQVSYRIRNGGDGLATEIGVSLELPQGLTLTNTGPDTNVDVPSHRTRQIDYHLIAQEEGKYLFPSQVLSYRSTDGETHTCEVEPLDVQVFFSGSSCLVGRVEDLNFLSRLSDLSSSGRGQVVLVTGESGVGKSRLTEEFIRMAKRRGFVGFRSRCSQFHVAMPCFPFRGIAEQLFQALSVGSENGGSSEMSDRLVGLGIDLRYAVQVVAPFVERGIPLGDNLGASIREGFEASTQRERFFLAFLNLLRGFAGADPVVLWLDDLQWCDSGSLDLLQFIVSNLTSMRVLIVVTCRSEDLDTHSDDSGPLRQTIRELSRQDSYHEIRLGTLGEVETGAIVDSVFPDSDFPEGFNGVVHQETEGNSFFVLSVLQSLVESKAITKDQNRWVFAGDASDIGVPDRVEKVVQEQLARLDRDKREELQRASVIGREFLFSILQAVSNRNEDELIDYLEDYVSRHLIKEVAANEERYAFNHARIQQVVYDGIPGLRRRRLHRKVAAVLESVYVDQLDQLAPILAEHYYRAGDIKATLGYLLRSMRLNIRCYNNAEAWKEIRQATQLLELVGDSELQGRIKVHLVRETGVLKQNEGDYEDALADYAWCLDHARAACDKREEARALGNLGNICFLRDQFVEAETHYLQCKDIAEALVDLELLTEVLADMGTLYYEMAIWRRSLDQEEKAEEATNQGQWCMEQVLYEASRIQDWEALRRAHDILGLIWMTNGQFDRAIESCEKGLEISRRYGLINESLNSLGEAYRRMGRFQQSLVVYDEFLKFADQAGAKRDQVLALNNLGVANYEQGNYDTALDYLDRSLILNEQVGYINCRIETLIIKGMVLEAQDKRQQAFDLFKESLRALDNLEETDNENKILRKVGTERYANGEFRQSAHFFQRYLEAEPDSTDFPSVRAMLERATTILLETDSHQS